EPRLDHDAACLAAVGDAVEGCGADERVQPVLAVLAVGAVADGDRGVDLVVLELPVGGGAGGGAVVEAGLAPSAAAGAAVDGAVERGRAYQRADAVLTVLAVVPGRAGGAVADHRGGVDLADLQDAVVGGAGRIAVVDAGLEHHAAVGAAVGGAVEGRR